MGPMALTVPIDACSSIYQASMELRPERTYGKGRPLTAGVRCLGSRTMIPRFSQTSAGCVIGPVARPKRTPEIQIARLDCRRGCRACSSETRMTECANQRVLTSVGHGAASPPPRASAIMTDGDGSLAHEVHDLRVQCPTSCV